MLRKAEYWGFCFVSIGELMTKNVESRRYA
jgi:hypothetical protein